MTDNIEAIKHYDKIHTDFGESVYQKMAQERYGIEFCCKPQLNSLIGGIKDITVVRKEILDTKNLQEPNLVRTFE